MSTPRPYLSYSQLATFEMNPRKYLDLYLYEKDQHLNKNMRYGTKMASGLELGEAVGDPVLDLVMARLPKFELMDKVIEDEKGVEIYDPHTHRGYKVPFLEDGAVVIPLLAKPDTAKADYTEFKEFKTSTVRWTQQKVEESGQLTFYATAIWLKTRKLPLGIELVNVLTEYTENGQVSPTGEICRFWTKRSLPDILRMTARIKRAWRGIKELVESEVM